MTATTDLIDLFQDLADDVPLASSAPLPAPAAAQVYRDVCSKCGGSRDWPRLR